MMFKHKDQKLFETWDEHWRRERTLTPVGKVFCPLRMKAIKNAMQDLGVKSAIDVGCGFGYVLEVLRELRIDYVGIDVSSPAVSLCKKMGLNARTGNMETENGNYDLVVAEGMLEHFLNFEPYARHMMRLSERYVLLMQPNHDSKMGMTLAYLTRLLRGRKCVFEYNYKMKDYIRIFEKNGFSLIKSEPLIWDTSRLLLFEKQ